MSLNWNKIPSCESINTQKKLISRSNCELHEDPDIDKGKSVEEEIKNLVKIGKTDGATDLARQLIILKRQKMCRQMTSSNKISKTSKQTNRHLTKSMPAINEGVMAKSVDDNVNNITKTRGYEKKTKGFLEFSYDDLLAECSDEDALVRLILDEISMELEMDGLTSDIRMLPPLSTRSPSIHKHKQTIINQDFKASLATLHTAV